jgi:hypothetical protein
VIITGLGGEPEYDRQFQELAERCAAGLRKSGIPPANLIVLPAERATRAELAKTFQGLAGRLKFDDTLVVLLIGHGSWDGHDYKFNVPGPDPTGAEFRQWFDRVPAGRQVIVNSSSSGGAAIPVWSKAGRAVLSATRSGEERNATVFMRFFAESLSDPAADQDKNGVVSALEAYRYAAQRVAKFYEAAGRLATEHPLLEDTGDGHGQKDPSPQNGEGLLAGTIPLIRISAQTARLDTPQARELRARKETLENDIAILKYRKSSMDGREYTQQLEKLLLELARAQQALEKLESGRP